MRSENGPRTFRSLVTAVGLYTVSASAPVRMRECPTMLVGCFVRSQSTQFAARGGAYWGTHESGTGAMKSLLGGPGFTRTLAGLPTARA